MAHEEIIGSFEARRVQRMLDRLYLGHLRATEQIAVSGWRQGQWLCVRWELADAKRSFVYSVDCRLDIGIERLPETTAKEVLYDFLGGVFETYLVGAREPFTGLRWETVEFAGRVLHVRGQERNEAAESAADQLLDEHERGDGPGEHGQQE